MRTRQESLPPNPGVPDRPVFLDESGKRARWIRWVARGVKALMPAWLVAVLLGALTPIGLPALPLEVAASHGARNAATSRAAVVPVRSGAVRSVPVSLRASGGTAARGAGRAEAVLRIRAGAEARAERTRAPRA